MLLQNHETIIVKWEIKQLFEIYKVNKLTFPGYLFHASAALKRNRFSFLYPSIQSIYKSDETLYVNSVFGCRFQVIE